MVSEHANPLAQLGGVDAGGQNVHVGELAAAFARRDHDVTVYTRRDDPALDTTITTDAGYRVVHVPVGPAKPIPKDDILPHLGEFATFLREQWSANRPDLVHAHFWMSAVAAELAASRELRIPVVLTFHALGTVKRRYQGAADTSPPARIKLERLVANRAHHVIATCTDEVEELGRMGLPHARATVVPCGVDLARFGPHGPADERGGGHRLVSVGRLVPRKGFDTTIKALALLPDTELLIAGGSADGDDPTGAESRRLHRVAVDAGVADRVHLLGQVTREGPCPRCCVRRTSLCARPGTSRSGWCRSRRWPAANRWWPARSAGCSTPWSTASPAPLSIRRTRVRSRVRFVRCSRTTRCAARGARPDTSGRTADTPGIASPTRH
ncbi:Glycosyl transferases group 1 [Nocardia amikacinitolerans]|nr:Glycosyl transferases group 1 [Nocardia amikacinitolerans]